MICRGLPLRPREIEGYDPRLVREVLETMVLEGWVAYDDRGDVFEPGPRVERFDAGAGSPVDALGDSRAGTQLAPAFNSPLSDAASRPVAVLPSPTRARPTRVSAVDLSVSE